MRLLTVGLIAIVFATTAIAVNRLVEWEGDNKNSGGFGSDNSSNQKLGVEAFSTRESEGGLTGKPLGKWQASMLRRAPEGAILLSGMPSYANAVFYTPLDVRPTSGRLRINALTQSNPGVEAQMRVSVNGTRRADILLEPGQNNPVWFIELSPEDLGAGRVSVDLSLVGHSPNAPCTAGRDMGAAVSFQANSSIDIGLESALETPRDKAYADGGVVRARWRDLDENQRRIALVHGSYIARHGMRMAFGDDGLNIEELLALRDSLGVIPAPKARPIQWPVYLLQTTDETPSGETRTFQGQTTWTMTFPRDGLPENKVPGMASIEMFLGPSPDDSRWTVSANLNGSLLDVYSTDPSGGVLKLDMALPRNLLRRQNDLSITAYSARDLEGICNAGPTYTAELKASSKLLPGGDTNPAAMDIVAERLSRGAQVALHLDPSLTGPEASVLAHAIADTMPPGFRL